MKIIYNALLNLFYIYIWLVCQNLQAAPLTPEKTQEITKLIHKVLIENPQILADAIQALRIHEQKKQQKNQEMVLKTKYNDLFLSNDPYIGNPKGKIVIAYFSDYNCSFCKKQDDVLYDIVQKFSEVKILFKELPILTPSSKIAAELMLVSFKQHPNLYTKIHRKLMHHKSPHDKASIQAIFKSENVDTNQLEKLVDETVQSTLNNNRQLAIALNIQGTPALVFEDAVLGGFSKLDILTKQINDRLKQ